MSAIKKIKRALRGDVKPAAAIFEAIRRGQASVQRGRDRARFQRNISEPARLRAEFANLSSAALLDHFHSRSEPKFFAGFASPDIAAAQRSLFPDETDELLARAERIVNQHCWPLLGLGEQDFGNPIAWHRDPLSGFEWPLDYAGDINLLRSDGSDVRCVWELNRLGHFLTLARAYQLTKDERFAEEFFQQLASWIDSNPPGRGVNWNCAMEVALRAMNLLAALEVFRHAPGFDEARLLLLLQTLDQHGRFIRAHLEFSYIATSNHYLSDVVGLRWLGIMLPELQAAAEWRTFGLREMLREMDKQVLADGADFESSTGYHRFVLELFAYSFLLCRQNGSHIRKHYWNKLQKMFRYVSAYLRPDGYAPLIGDSDSGQVLPLLRRRADDHAYVLSIGAVLFDDPQLKTETVAVAPELLWLLGEAGVEKFRELDASRPHSQTFPAAGVHIMRDDDLYLLFNASGAGIDGRGSHGQNDALSIEVSACGRAFIVDPGTYVYTADLRQRNLFRATAYHSTVEIDGSEQNTTYEAMPFVIGDEASPEILLAAREGTIERVSGEHYGYRRLAQPVSHRRTITFNKRDRYWLVHDQFRGRGEHRFATRFHFAPGLDVRVSSDGNVRAVEPTTNDQLLVCPLKQLLPPELEPQFTSSDYGQKSESSAACWSDTASVPVEYRWVMIPVRAGEDAEQRLQLVRTSPEALAQK